METGPPGPAHLLLTAAVARRYYRDGQTKKEIGDALGLSRFKVARLLESALDSGLVRITIGYPGVLDVELSGQVQDMFGISHAVVLGVDESPGPDGLADIRAHIGHAAAQLLNEIITADDVLGLTWSRSVTVMAHAVKRLPTVPVIQLCGALELSSQLSLGDDNSVELVRKVARVAGGPAYYFYVPMIVADAATAQALREQPGVVSSFAQFRRVTRAVAGIGMWAPGLSTVYDSVGADDRAELTGLGVCAEVAGVFMDADGALVPTRLSERVIGITGAELQHIPEVIGMPYDHTKAVAVRAALRSGIVNGLVTHSSMATALLELGP